MKFWPLIMLSACASTPVSAAVDIVFEEVGNDVTATASGSLTFVGLTQHFLVDIVGAGVNPGIGLVLMNTGFTKSFTGFAGPDVFGPGTGAEPTSSAGDAFGIMHVGKPIIMVPIDYVEGATINANQTFSNASFASLGIQAGQYIYTWQSDSLRINFVGGPVPEPAAWAMMIGGFAIVGAGLRRRKGAKQRDGGASHPQRAPAFNQ